MSLKRRTPPKGSSPERIAALIRRAKTLAARRGAQAGGTEAGVGDGTGAGAERGMVFVDDEDDDEDEVMDEDEGSTSSGGGAHPRAPPHRGAGKPGRTTRHGVARREGGDPAVVSALVVARLAGSSCSIPFTYRTNTFART